MLPPQSKLSISVVPDLACDARFSERSYIMNPPYNRFYAGIPIQTSKGINIGVFCVFDSKPREGLDIGQLQFLHDISRTVMDHWESKASAINFRKSDRSKL